MEELISVLIPVYNAESTIIACLDSVSHQHYSNFEVIVVDDGSTDHTPELLRDRATKDHRIKIFTLDSNRGIVEAMNVGLAQCNANWIARMDADDTMRPDRLSAQITFISQHPQIDILGAQVRIFRHDGTDLTPGQKQYRDWSNALITDGDIKKNIFAESPIMHPTFFLKKSVYQSLGGYQNNPWAEDYDFLLRAYLRGFRFGKIAEILVDKGDSPTRLARVDFRCKRKAMFQAKATYFSRLIQSWSNRTYIIVGSGNSGQLAKTALKKEGVEPACFVDNNPSDLPRKKKGLPIFSLRDETADRLIRQFQDPFFLLCVGVPKARQTIEKILKERGFKEEADYVRFI